MCITIARGVQVNEVEEVLVNVARIVELSKGPLLVQRVRDMLKDEAQALSLAWSRGETLGHYAQYSLAMETDWWSDWTPAPEELATVLRNAKRHISHVIRLYDSTAA